jgi:hypothetical protein
LEKTVIFVITGSAGSASIPSITNLTGQAVLGNLPLPPGDYTVSAYFGQTVTLDDGKTTLDLRDERYGPSSANGTLTLLSPPDCTGAKLSITNIWPPDNRLWPASVIGVTDADGDPITITITSIFQDEPVGTGPQSPDGFGVGTATAQLRAERDGKGDGRVYHVGFSASEGRGGVCSAVVRVGVVENQSTPVTAIDGGVPGRLHGSGN